MRLPIPRISVSLVGLFVCSATAALLCFAFRDSAAKAVLPIAFLVVITILALRLGSMAGIVATTLSATIFALFLLPPIHSFVVADLTQRMALAWFLFGGIAISFLFGAAKERSVAKKR